MARESSQPRSSILLDEHFFRGDDRFLDELRMVHAPKRLAALAERWKKDPRPWARRQILAYLEHPLGYPGHEPVVKRLFKHAEAQHDDELMAAFLVAFDRLIRHIRRTRWQYDWQTRQSWEEERLVLPHDRAVTSRIAQNPSTLERIEVPGRSRAGLRLFSVRTRYYLRRRAWRYFRRMGFQRPDAYVAAVSRALMLYRDEDLARGESILDCWALLQVGFRCHDALHFRAGKVALAEERSIDELNPAPRFPKLWQQPEAAATLLPLATKAPARFVRLWAMGVLRRDHKSTLATLKPEALLELLDHEDGEVQAFGAELFGSLGGLEKLPLETWLRLLQTKNPSVLATLCDAMVRHVTPDRLTLAQCMDLACSAPTPVARLGLDLLRKRTVSTPADLALLVRLAEARCAAVGGAITEWVLGLIGTPQHYDRGSVTEFFDSLLPEARQAAMAWLKPGSPGYDDPQLWAALIESPFDDVRLSLIKALDKRSKLPGVGGDRLVPVWSSVILGVHRGGRQKPRAVRQLADAIAADPAKADMLAPVLAVAVNSIRGPERRAGLAAVVSLLERCPEAAPAIRKVLPGLRLVDAAEGVPR